MSFCVILKGDHMSEVNEYLPLTEATLYILLSLANAPKHGYAIMQEVAGLSNARIHLSTGTLYGALKRLLEHDWVARVDGTEQDPETQRPRKEYILTPLGRRILIAESQRLDQLARLAQQRLQGDVL
jgi:DNA-binding PadR family transcriptional regulator